MARYSRVSFSFMWSSDGIWQWHKRETLSNGPSSLRTRVLSWTKLRKSSALSGIGQNTGLTISVLYTTETFLASSSFSILTSPSQIPTSPGLAMNLKKIPKKILKNETFQSSPSQDPSFSQTIFALKWEELAWVRHSSTWEELDKFKCPEAKCCEKPWKVRARTYGSKSPSRSEAPRFIDSAKSPRWGFGWVDKAQCFRSARRFGAVGSSPDFSGFFTTFGF